MIPVPVDFPVLQSEAAIVLDLDEQGREISDGAVVETGPRVLYEKNADAELPVASLTKMMTTLLVLEKISDGELSLKDEVAVRGEMLVGLEGFAVVGLATGQIWTVEDLLYATMLPSAGDAAQAVAIAAGGSLDEFVAEMNRRAGELGLERTKFSNVVGFDEGNYSTAREMAKLLEVALENEEFVKIFNAKEHYVAPLGKSVKKTLAATAEKNSIDVGMIVGAKTGYTNVAGRCLASVATEDGENLLMVNLGADYKGLGYIEDPVNVYSYLGGNYEKREVMPAGEVVWQLPVENSPQGEYEVRLLNEARVYLPKNLGKNAIVPKFIGVEKVADGTKKGEKLGILTLNWVGNDGAEQIIYTAEVELEDEIYYYNWPLYVGMGTGVIVVISGLIFKRKRSKMRVRLRR